MNSLLTSVLLYSIALAGIFVLRICTMKWRSWDPLTKIFSATVIVTILHIWEENAIPGGFTFLYNYLQTNGAGPLDRYPLNPLTDSITNGGAILIGMGILIFGRIDRRVAVGTCLFSFVEVFAHVVTAFISFQMFQSKGQTFVYSPGMVTAVLGFLPSLIITLVYFYRHEVPSWREWLQGAIGGVIFLGLLVFCPEALLKDKDSPYSNPNLGFYRFMSGDY